MALDHYQQIQRLIRESKNILLCLPSEADIDTIMAAHVYGYMLQNYKKKFTLVSQGYKPHHSKIFSSIKKIPTKQLLPPLRQLIIRLNTSKIPLDAIYRVTKKTYTELHLKSINHSFLSSDISIYHTPYLFDLVIFLGATNLESLGPLSEEYINFFHHVAPSVNIDYHPENERMGHVNYVNITCTSLCELLLYYIRQQYPKIIIPHYIAQYLLTGIIDKTSGLRIQPITPRLISSIEYLVSCGASISDINEKLFHTKSISQLKLWARILTNLKEDTNLKIVWSLIYNRDFKDTNTTTNDVAPIINELITTYRGARFVFILWENEDHSIAGVFTNHKQHDAFTLMSLFNPKGKRDMVEFNVYEKNLETAEKKVYNSLRDKIQYLNHAPNG